MDAYGLIPEPWDMMAFLDRVARWRRRSIKVIGRDGDYWATGENGDYLSGLCIWLDRVDVILYRTDGGPLAAQHIIAHELAHLLAGHALSGDMSDCLESHDPIATPTREVLERSCARSRFDDPDERFAEAFADLLLTSVSRRGTPPQRRLAKILGRREI